MQPIGANIKKPGSGVAETGPSLRERVSPFSRQFLQKVHLAARKRNETKRNETKKYKGKNENALFFPQNLPEPGETYQVTFWKEKEERKGRKKTVMFAGGWLHSFCSCLPHEPRVFTIMVHA